ncbi:transketolase [Pontimonas sp.]|nr:transketolase [Pontimonas sp.]
MASLFSPLDSKAVDVAKGLAADAVEKVGNGHPGTAISLAPLAYLLYQRVMAVDPQDPKWLGRDRFILSAGHSSLTQYVQLFLGGFGLELADLQALRTWDSRTPGHPEFGHTDHVEITTGPLGQGIASATGFAYAQRFERGLFDPDATPGASPFDHYTYVIAGDGDMQEGVSAEAASLAGHQQLGNLIVFYDANQISIEDDVDIAFSEDVAARYEAYGWDVHTVDFHQGETYSEDVDALMAAITQAKAQTGKPSLITVKTIIGWPSPTKQNTGGIHGSALGADEVAGLKQELGLPADETFFVPEDVLEHTRQLRVRAAQARADWDRVFAHWAEKNPERKALLDRLLAGEVPSLEEHLPVFDAGSSVATRQASGTVLNALAGVLPEMWGGSADLAGSNLTTISGAHSFAPVHRSTSSWAADPYGRVLHFGIREHAMGSILNGILLHGPTRAFGGTFLIFSEYMRPAVRLAALMKIPAIYVWTHDSIGVGEDGPTHQPVEQLASLRAIPGLDVVRPADANETAWAWKTILERQHTPAGLALTRQGVPTLERGAGEATSDSLAHARLTARGGYVLAEASGQPEVLLIATGSEVALALNARAELERDGIPTRVVSMPCVEWFDEQDADYREAVLPRTVQARVTVEAGISQSWHRFLGAHGTWVSLEHFGASADAATLYTKFGITAEAVVAAARASIDSARKA